MSKAASQKKPNGDNQDKFLYEVNIQTGPHSQKEPKNARRCLALLFQASGFSVKDKITVQLGPRIRASEDTPVYQLGNITPRKSIELKMKSDDNSSRFLYFLFMPQKADISPEEFRRRLSEGIDILAKEPPKPVQAQKVNPLETDEFKKKLSHVEQKQTQQPPEIKETPPPSEEPAETQKKDLKTSVYRKVKDELSSPEIIHVLLEELAGKVDSEGVIKQTDLFDVFGALKLKSDKYQVVKFLLDKKHLVKLDKEPGSSTVRYGITSAKPHRKTSALSTETEILQPEDLAVLSQMLKDAEEHSSRVKLLQETREMISTLKTQLRKFEQEEKRLENEIERSRASTEKLAGIKKLLALGA